MTDFSGSIQLAESQSGIFLTSQEKDFCKGVAQGQPPVMVAKTVGIHRSKVGALLARADIVETLSVLKSQVDDYMGIQVTRDLLNGMLFEAHATADCSNAKIASIRELGKMNGLYEAEKKELTISAATKIEHLESLTDEELLQRANMQLDLKNPRQDIIDVVSE